MSPIKSLSVSALVLLSSASLTACEPQPPALDWDIVQRVDLSAALDVEEVSVAGITVDPETGVRFVLESTGIYSIDGAGQAELVLALADFPEPDVPLRSGFLDIAAMGGGRFALVAVGDGYLLDTNEGTLSQWFCYEPGWMGGQGTGDQSEWEQQSANLAYDASTDQILSAPLTLNDGNVLRSDVATFDGAGAGDLSWFQLENGSENWFGGLALEPEGTLLLGAESNLFRYTMGSSELELLGSLEAYGVDEITGLMYEPDSGHLMVTQNAELLIFEM